MAERPEHLDLIFQWEVRSWSRAYPLWHRTLQEIKGDRCNALALGERDGGLSLMLAEHGFTTVCSDLHGPSEKARDMHRALGWAPAVTYERIDALAIPKPDASVDVVAFKSMIGALGTKDRQQKALAEMHRVLRPGGVLLFAENLQGSTLHRWLRKRFVPWDAYWRYLDAKEDLDLFEAFGSMDEHTTGFLANLGRTEWQRDLLARTDGIIISLVPESMRTIWYGVARKRGS